MLASVLVTLKTVIGGEIDWFHGEGKGAFWKGEITLLSLTLGSCPSHRGQSVHPDE